MRFTPIEDASAWTAATVGPPARWARALDPRERAALRALAGEDAPLRDEVRRLLDEVLADTVHGRGFAVVRGLPIERLADEDAARLLWRLGAAMGQPVPQNQAGERLVQVRDQGGDGRRGYQTSEALGFHTDSSDLAALLCVRPAPAGGRNRVVSAAAIYNEILRSHRHLLGLLYSGFSYDRRGEHGAGESPVTGKVPVFSCRDGQVSCRYLRGFIEAAAERTGIPLSPVEIDALDLFDRLAGSPDLHVEFSLDAGDLLLVNNYTVLHARTAFGDAARSGPGRLLLRLWLHVPGCRPLDPAFLRRDGGADSRFGRPTG